MWPPSYMKTSSDDKYVGEHRTKYYSRSFFHFSYDARKELLWKKNSFDVNKGPVPDDIYMRILNMEPFIKDVINQGGRGFVKSVCS